MRDENVVFQEWQAAEGSRREELLEELVRLLQRHAFAVVWNKLQEHRPDIVSVAVHCAIEKSVSFRNEAKFSTWFQTIVTNACNQALKEKLSKPRENPLEDYEEI